MGYMAGNLEFRVHSIAYGPKGIDLIRHIEDGRELSGNLVLVQIRYGREHTREHLGLVANVAFDIRPLKQEEIFESDSLPADEDSAFAAQFGFTLIPRLAHLSLTPDGAIEAWISSALVPNQYQIATHETNLSSTPSPRFRFSNGEVVRGLDQLTIARYIRLTVEDRASVLGEILAAVAEQEINVHEFIQPKPEKDSPTAKLFAILNLCSGESFGRALNAIRTLPSCVSIDAVFPVVGLGRHGILPEFPA